MILGRKLPGSGLGEGRIRNSLRISFSISWRLSRPASNSLISMITGTGRPTVIDTSRPISMRAEIIAPRGRGKGRPA